MDRTELDQTFPNVDLTLLPARRTLELLAELAAPRARFLSRLLKCAVNFRENFFSRGRDEKNLWCLIFFV